MSDTPAGLHLTVAVGDNGVAVVGLCQPELHNRFDGDMHGQFIEALHATATNPAVLATVLAAQGKVFSGGGDTNKMLAGAAMTPHDRMIEIDEGRELFRRVADYPKPLVVALHGHVFGLGASLILMADAIVSTPGVRIADPHVHMGLVAGDGGVVAWPANLASTLAKRHLLWGEPLLAEDAHRLGVVTDLVDSVDAVRPKALELAQRVAALPPIAVQLTKRALNQVGGSRINEAFDLGFYLEAISLGTSDMIEAVTAFKQKRPGVWTGR